VPAHFGVGHDKLTNKKGKIMDPKEFKIKAEKAVKEIPFNNWAI
jgi:hypothetical protein